MPLLDEVATLLADRAVASSSGAAGWYLWRGHMPDSTAIDDKAVTLVETPGYPPELRPGVEYGGLQTLVRGNSVVGTATSYQDTEFRAKRIAMELLTVGGESLSGRHYVGIWAEQEPFFVGLDANERPVFSCNFRVGRAVPTTS